MPTTKPPLLLTREQCRAVDRYAIEQLGIPGVVLMENAGRNAADRIERWTRQGLQGHAGGEARRRSTAPICIVCGKGNNGGDGFVIARQLANRGWPVHVDLAAEPDSLAGDAAINFHAAERMGVPICVLKDNAAIDEAAGRWRKARVIVDALLGTGFAGEVRQPLAEIIEHMNAAAHSMKRSAPLLVAVDVPSGLDADTGIAAGAAIRAHRTITFLAGKVGYQNRTARAHLGRVTVCDIGAPLPLMLERLAK